MNTRPIKWLLGLTLIHGLWYAAIVHPWQVPDEHLHYEYLRMLVSNKTLELTSENRSSAIQWQVAESLWEFQHWRFRDMATIPEDEFRALNYPFGDPGLFLPQTPLFYLSSVPFYWATSSRPVLDQLYVLRFYSVLLHVLTVWLTYKLAKIMMPEPSNHLIVLASAAFVAILPQYTFISASYNNDNLVPPLIAGVLITLLTGFQRGCDPRWLLAAFGLAGLSFLTKRTAIGIIAVLGIGLIAYAIFWLRSERRRNRWIGAVSIGLVIIAMIMSLLILIFPVHIPNELARTLRLGSDAIISLTDFLKEPARLMAINWRWWFSTVVESLWGRFGWMNVRLDPILMRWVKWLKPFLVGGSVLGLVRLSIKEKSGNLMSLRIFSVVLLWAGLLFTGLAMVAQFLINPIWYGPQGRYFFPFVSALAILVVMGWQALWPRRWSNYGLLLWMGMILLFDTFAWLSILWAYYT
jgi:4-amino-4-deoxy-L-arabinose transferase-like glycosyltransferase